MGKRTVRKRGESESVDFFAGLLFAISITASIAAIIIALIVIL